METDRYYRHSGRFAPLAVVKALGAGVVSAVPLAFVYSYVLVYIPIIGTITFALTGGFALLIGLAVGKVLHDGKVRNLAVSTATALGAALFSLWAAWVTWVHAILGRADAKVTLADLALDPALLWKVITLINDKGAWNLRGLTPTGALLWGLWALEAAVIGGVVVLAVRESVNDPFCEACDRWCAEHKGFGAVGPARLENLAPRLERGDYTVLRELPNHAESVYTRLDVHDCPQCHATTTLSATNVTVTVKKGKAETTEDVIFKHLLLPPGDLAVVQAMLAAAAAPEPEVAPAGA
jgi:hypothetical protein